MKIVIVLMLVAVLGALASAGAFMLKKKDESGKPRQDRRMARALALRVGLSVALFLFVLLSWRMGWIRPTGIPAGS